MTRTAAAEVRLADVEPVLSFITRVIAADRLGRAISAEQMAALPDPVIRAICVLQDAVGDLAAAPAEPVREEAP